MSSFSSWGRSFVLFNQRGSLVSHTSTQKFVDAVPNGDQAASLHTAAAAINNINHASTIRSKLGGMVPEFGPIWMVFGILGGLVGVAGMIGIHSAKQQLLNSPSVQVTKKNRQSFPEVDNPDAVISSADKFLNKSFFRKVAHIQDNVDPNRPNPFTRSRNIETLKSVGVHT